MPDTLLTRTEKKIRVTAQTYDLTKYAGWLYYTLNSVRFARHWDKPLTFRECQFIVGKDHSLYPTVKLGVFEENEFNWILSQIKPGDVVWDIGANIGLYSVLCANVDPNVTVHAFEPWPATVEKLKRNVTLNELNNVTVHGVAVSDTVGVTGFVANSQTPGCNHLDTNAVNKVRTVTGEDLLRHGVPIPNVVKVDVEGLEPEVFAGMRSVVETSKPLLIFEVNASKINLTNWKSEWKPLLDWLFQIYGSGVWFCNGNEKTVTHVTYNDVKNQGSAASLGFQS